MPQKKHPHLAGYCKAQKKVVMWYALQDGLSKVGCNVRQHATQFFVHLIGSQDLKQQSHQKQNIQQNLVAVN